MSADVWIEAKACESCGVHGQILHALHAGYIEILRLEYRGRRYDASLPTEHQPGVHRLIRHYRRTSVPVVVAVAS